MLKSYPKPSGKSGFTLIELLVVIAIIAILAAILFPVFVTAKEKGREVKCSNNMKQIALAFQQYQSDWNDKFGFLMWQSGGWWKEIYPYTKNKKMFECPSLVLKGIPQSDREWWMGYSMNRFLHAPDGEHPSNPGVDYVGISQIEKPTRTILQCESKQVYSYSPYFDWSCAYLILRESWDPKEKYVPADRHNSGGNYSFVDGHTKWMKRDQTVKPELLWDISPSIPYR